MPSGVPPLTEPPEVVDAAVAAYVCWREECEGAREAYRRWSSASEADRMLASCAYMAALEREEAAAIVYAKAMRQLRYDFVDGPLAETRRARSGSAPRRAGRRP